MNVVRDKALLRPKSKISLPVTQDTIWVSIASQQGFFPGIDILHVVLAAVGEESYMVAAQIFEVW